ncbi:MAG: hypothetical protein OXI26_02110 [bacterium]|nr:hypothetical protein [bacterium]
MPAASCPVPRQVSGPIYGVRGPVHGPEHVTWDEVAPSTLAYRCTVETDDGTRCGPITLPPPLGLPWSVRFYCMLPERATLERIMCTLVIGFWIGALIWVRFVL